MKRNQLKMGVILSYIQVFLNIIISIIYTPVMLRILGQGEYGLYSTVSSMVSWLSLLSLGFGSSYIKFYSTYKVKKDVNAIAILNGMFMTIFCIIGVVALACGLFLANHLELIYARGLSVDEYRTAKVLTCVVTFDLAISFPASVFNAIIRSQEKFIQVKMINMFQSVVSPLVTLPILLMGHGSIGMVAVTTGINLIAYSLNAFYCFRRLNTRFIFSKFDKELFTDIAKFSIFIAINSIINQINSNLDKVLLARYNGTTCVAVYAIGFSLYSYYIAFSNAINGVFTPRIHKIVSQYIDNKKLMKKQLTDVFVQVGRLQFFVQMLLCTGIFLFGREFIRLWAGYDYTNSYYVALVLCVSNTIPLCQSVGMEIQRAQNKHQIRSLVYIFMSIINIILTIILCQKYGEIGAVIGTAVATVVVDVIFINIYYHKCLYVDVICYWKNIGRVCAGIIVPLSAGVCIKKFMPMNSYFFLCVGILIYTCIYCGSIWCFSMNHDEKTIIFLSRKNNKERGNEK